MIIIGSKGHAKEILNVLEVNNNLSQVHFFDNVSKTKETHLYNRFPIIRTNESLKQYFQNNSNAFVLGVGGCKIRLSLTELAENLGGELTSIISENAIIGKHDTIIGKGVNVMHGVVINNSVSIGTGCLINANTTIHHDCVIGDFCEISPNASITGRVKIGNYCSIGTGAIILPDLEIGDNVIIGAGAVVTKSVKPNQTIMGVPGKVR